MSSGCKLSGGGGDDVLAVAQHRDDVGDRLDLFQPVRDVDDRDPFRLEFADELEQRRGLDWRERRSGFVEDCDAVRRRQRASDLRELPPRDGEPLHRHGDGNFDAEDAHRLFGARVHRPVVDGDAATQLAAEKHVLGDRKIRGEHDLLVHQHDAAPLGVDRSAQRQRRAVESERAARRVQVTADDLHQGRLAGAVFADDRMDLAGVEGEADVGEHFDRAERLRQAACLQQRLVAAPRVDDIALERHRARPAPRRLDGNAPRRDELSAKSPGRFLAISRPRERRRRSPERAGWRAAAVASCAAANKVVSLLENVFRRVKLRRDGMGLAAGIGSVIGCD